MMQSTSVMTFRVPVQNTLYTYIFCMFLYFKCLYCFPLYLYKIHSTSELSSAEPEHNTLHTFTVCRCTFTLNTLHLNFLDLYLYKIHSTHVQSVCLCTWTWFTLSLYCLLVNLYMIHFTPVHAILDTGTVWCFTSIWYTVHMYGLPLRLCTTHSTPILFALLPILDTPYTCTVCPCRGENSKNNYCLKKSIFKSIVMESFLHPKV